MRAGTRVLVYLRSRARAQTHTHIRVRVRIYMHAGMSARVKKAARVSTMLPELSSLRLFSVGRFRTSKTARTFTDFGGPETPRFFFSAWLWKTLALQEQRPTAPHRSLKCRA